MFQLTTFVAPKLKIIYQGRIYKFKPVGVRYGDNVVYHGVFVTDDEALARRFMKRCPSAQLKLERISDTALNTLPDTVEAKTNAVRRTKTKVKRIARKQA